MMDADATEAESLARLEAALDRIARQARPAPPAAAAPAAPSGTQAVAARLDAVIAHIRDALAAEG